MLWVVPLDRDVLNGNIILKPLVKEKNILKNGRKFAS